MSLSLFLLYVEWQVAKELLCAIFLKPYINLCSNIPANQNSKTLIYTTKYRDQKVGFTSVLFIDSKYIVCIYYEYKYEYYVSVILSV